SAIEVRSGDSLSETRAVDDATAGVMNHHSRDLPRGVAHELELRAGRPHEEKRRRLGEEGLLGGVRQAQHEAVTVEGDADDAILKLVLAHAGAELVGRDGRFRAIGQGREAAEAIDDLGRSLDLDEMATVLPDLEQ